MEKYILSQYGDITVYNTDGNTVFYPKYNDCRIYIADEDTQIISMDEVTDVKTGDIILVLYKYDSATDSTLQKTIVVTDPMALHDLKEWQNNNTNEAS